MQISLAAGAADQIEAWAAQDPAATELATAVPSVRVLEEHTDALEAGLDHVRTEAERHFAVLEERWLDGKAEPLIKRIEEIADAL